MTCSASCGSDRELMELLIENAINKALVEGKLQAGLKDCGGGSVGKDAKVILCGTLVATVNEAIKNGEIDVVKDATVENGKLKVTKGNGSQKEIALPFAQMAIGDKEVVLTNTDGQSVAVPKANGGLSDGDFDKTIVKGANEANKFGVKAKANGGLETGADGVGVKVKENGSLESGANGIGVKVKPNGGLETTGDGVGIKAGDGLKVGEDGSLQVGEIFTKKPVTGKGTKADPLSVEFSNKDFIVNPATGEVTLKPVNVEQITNLNTGFPQLGYSVYYGFVNKERGQYVTGVPANVVSADVSQPSTTSLSEVTGNTAYDFNGWQIASPEQVDQYLVGADDVIWHRTNEGGMNRDGSLKDPSGWSTWKRETNVAVTVVQTNALQQQVNDLTKRVAALEEILAGFVPLKDASGTEQIGLIKP